METNIEGKLNLLDMEDNPTFCVNSRQPLFSVICNWENTLTFSPIEKNFIFFKLKTDRGSSSFFPL